jgi:hypothetical protein
MNNKKHGAMTGTAKPSALALKVTGVRWSECYFRSVALGDCLVDPEILDHKAMWDIV